MPTILENKRNQSKAKTKREEISEFKFFWEMKWVGEIWWGAYISGEPPTKRVPKSFSQFWSSIFNYWSDDSGYSPEIISNILKALKSSNAWALKIHRGLPKRPLKKRDTRDVSLLKLAEKEKNPGKGRRFPKTESEGRFTIDETILVTMLKKTFQ